MDPSQLDYWSQRAAQLTSLLNSPQGQNLGAGDFNSLRDAQSYAVNSRGGPAPYQATYYAQQPQTQVPVMLGTGERQNVGLDPNVLAGLIQSSRGNPQPQWNESNSGNDFGYNSLAASAPQAPQLTSPAQRMAWIQSQRALRTATAPQQSGYYEQTFGVDPFSDQLRAQKNMEAAIAMQQKQAEMQKTGFDAFTTATKSLGADNPQEFLTSYNTDPSRPNQFLIQGKTVPDTNMPGQFVQQPPRWQFVQPEAAKYALSLAPQGYSAGLSSDQAAQRFVALHAKGSPDMGTPAPSAPSQPSPTMDTAQAAANFRDQAGQWLGDTASSTVARSANFFNWLRNAGAADVNRIAGVLGANGNVVGYTPPAAWDAPKHLDFWTH